MSDMDDEYFIETTGDLLKADEAYIAHQCNCVTTHAGGLAAELFRRFPYADTYAGRKFPIDDDAARAQFGTIDVLGDGISQRRVINVYAQLYPGRATTPSTTNIPHFLDDTVVGRLAAFAKCLDAIVQRVKGTTDVVAFPDHIGCGLAGGDWPTYRQLIKDTAETQHVYFTIYKKEEDDEPRVLERIDVVECIDILSSTDDDDSSTTDDESEQEAWAREVRPALVSYEGVAENAVFLMHVSGDDYTASNLETNNAYLDIFVLFHILHVKNLDPNHPVVTEFLEYEYSQPNLEIDLQELPCTGLHEQQLVAAVHYFHRRHQDHDDAKHCRAFVFKVTDNESLVARVSGLREKLDAFSNDFAARARKKQRVE